MKLIKMMAKACHYAQDHIENDWPLDRNSRWTRLQCVSYQMACFLAQNTRFGNEGVEWDVVIDNLADHPMRSEKEWEKILNKIAKTYGGWKK